MRRQIIRTEEDRKALIEALKHDHPRNVADRFGLKPDTVGDYLHDAKEELRTELERLGLSVYEIEQQINRTFYRDGCTIRTLVWGE